MTRLQHFGWFFSRGFGPQAWGRDDYRWNYRWERPDIYQQSVRTLEQAGMDLVIIEDAPSIGHPGTLDLRVRAAYGGPKHDPLLLAPYLLAATSHIGVVPTVNAGTVHPYPAARQFATLAHLAAGRFGINVVTDVGSAHHYGLERLTHDGAYDRADEWMQVIRELWHSWDDGALIADVETGRFADGAKIRAPRFDGEYFRAEGPLNALPFGELGDPVIVSPGGSPRGLQFAGKQSDVQLALAPMDVSAVRGYREKVLQAATEAGRSAADIRILFVIKPEIVADSETVDRVVAASREPSEADLIRVLEGHSSDLETNLIDVGLDTVVDPGFFAEHVSRGSIRALLGDGTAGWPTLREAGTRLARKGKIADREGLVGTADQVADFIEEFGKVADNDGFIFSGDLHPTTLYRMLGDLVPILRRRGLLRNEFGAGGFRANLLDF
ncbi:LLM class flavin-dependent oxidoreductase [Nakamurella sp. A5-74]|uniref:LLM class flavin-dependent oxidoreductase n=1 Tax=Nakamurella sp. A5-74 TaxID=3158264 RepID=A0AAU8DMT9_9ACTN